MRLTHCIASTLYKDIGAHPPSYFHTMYSASTISFNLLEKGFVMQTEKKKPKEIMG